MLSRAGVSNSRPSEPFNAARETILKLLMNFRQYCDGSLSNKRLNHSPQATIVRYIFFSFEDCSTWCNHKTRFVALMMMVRRCWKGDDLFFFWRSTLLRATLQRSLPREVVISNSKTSCGPRHDCSHVQCGPQKPRV